MDHYIDIKIKKNEEFLPNVLLDCIYFNLHKSLYDFGEKSVGFSFPLFKENTLGNVVRLHGRKDTLKKLIEASWIDKYKGYLTITQIKAVPEKVGYRIVKRVQVKSNLERLLRRSLKNGRITIEEANQKLLSNLSQKTSLPYSRMRSISSNQHFRLFVEHGDIIESPINGMFSYYGLSQTATVPWF